MENKFCKFCGGQIPSDAVVCAICGRQVEELKRSENNVYNENERNKWISLLLCVFLGYLGAHKFYERKILFGIIYLFSFGLFGVGVIIDMIMILLKPNPYYV